MTLQVPRAAWTVTLWTPVVTVCTAGGHYTYRQWSLYLPPVVNKCTANGQYMYRQWSPYTPPVINICTASGHYMYRQGPINVPSVVNICTASGHYMYQRFNIQQFYFLPTQCIYFVWIWKQTAIIPLYSIDWLVFITETKCVYCAVRSTFYVLPTQCIYVFCVDLRTNSYYFTTQH